MAVIEYMNVVLGANHQKLDKDLDSANKKIHAFSMDIQGLGRSLAVVGAGVGVGALVKSSINLAAEAETAAVQFEVLTGSAEQATQIISQMRKLDQESPLAFTDFQQSAKALLGFGVSADQASERMRQLSMVSMGNAERFQSLSLAFAQTSAAGRLMGQEVLQFVNAGFNPLQAISKMTGESMAELKKRMEDGGVSVQEVGMALDFATGKGGLFFGMNEKIAQTTAGQLAKLQSDFKMLGVEIGNSLIPVLKEVVDLVRQFTGAKGEIAEVVRSFGVGVEFLRGELGGLGMTLEERAIRQGLRMEKLAKEEAKRKAESIKHAPKPDEVRKAGNKVQEEKDAQDVRAKAIEALEASKKAEEAKRAADEEARRAEQVARQLEMEQKRTREIEEQAKLKEIRERERSQERAAELINEDNPFASVLEKLVEGVKLRNDGFMTRQEFRTIAERESMKLAESQTVERRDTPTAMAGSVEAYRLFIERDSDRAKELEIATRAKDHLANIEKELIGRGLLGVAKR